MKPSEALIAGHNEIVSIKGQWFDVRRGVGPCGCAVAQIAWGGAKEIMEDEDEGDLSDLLEWIKASDTELYEYLIAEAPADHGTILRYDYASFAPNNSLVRVISNMYEDAENEDTQTTIERIVRWLQERGL